jgi:hypothetical protein
MAILSPITEVNGVIADKECRRCRHFPLMCHYWQNEGESFKELIVDKETGACKNFPA